MENDGQIIYSLSRSISLATGTILKEIFRPPPLRVPQLNISWDIKRPGTTFTCVIHHIHKYDTH